MHADVSFTVMGCQSRVIVNGHHADGLATWAIERLGQLEARWSRFRPDSEISELNRSRGALTKVSADTLTLIRLGVHAWEATSGRFDPTMLTELMANGYDRTHQQLAAPSEVRAGRLPPSGPVAVRSSRCGEIIIDPSFSAVGLPRGVRFDPGGIGKGLAADLVATELRDRGVTGAMIDLGGDIRVIGEHHLDGATWTVTIDDPLEVGVERYRLGLIDGGFATSSQLRRRWSTPQGDRHHLLDAFTGRSSWSPVATAVVAAGSAWWAEVLAKVALMAGFEAGIELLEDSRANGVLFAFDGLPRDAGLLTATTASTTSTTAASVAI